MKPVKEIKGTDLLIISLTNKKEKDRVFPILFFFSVFIILGMMFVAYME